MQLETVFALLYYQWLLSLGFSLVSKSRYFDFKLVEFSVTKESFKIKCFSLYGVCILLSSRKWTSALSQLNGTVFNLFFACSVLSESRVIRSNVLRPFFRAAFANFLILFKIDAGLIILLKATP